jgi:polyhydroxyalkanoate synthase subunit PhaC
VAKPKANAKARAAAKRAPRAAQPPADGAGSANGATLPEPPPATRPAAGGLDVLLTDATRGRLRRWLPARATVKTAAKLAVRPDAVAARGARLSADLAEIAAGRSEIEPDKRDRRFKDTAWAQNPAFRRVLQSYIATGRAVDGLICDADLDWTSERRIRFAAENVLDALAPSNVPWLNPTAIKTAVDTGGMNFVRGAANLARDMSRSPRIPTMVDRSAFEVGENVAATPGSVVLRTPVFELLQYEPSTPAVREHPLMVVPPMINKYYVADLAPGRSMIEYAVSRGQQVFAISWRNPDERHADWNFDTYASAVIEGLEAVEAITGSPRTHVLGLCAGGVVLSSTVAVLAARGEQDRIAGLSLGVCVLDNRAAGTASAFMDPATAALAVADSARRGYLDGRALAGVFAWLRPNDLVWNYWVSNYLLGKSPPAFDILYWNDDTTNMPAGLHRDFVRVALDNPLAYPGELEVLGTPVDLTRITTDTYLVAGIADHITPWTSCYRTVGLLGTEPRFVLSTSGHIAAMVNPPGSEKASFRVNDALPEDPEEWLAGATVQPGSWWVDWADWLGERSGEERDAPETLGDEAHRALARAPGTYVRE